MASRGICLCWMLLVGCVTTGCAGSSRPPPRASEATAPRDADVVLLFDQSTAGLLASGVDVDEDGVVGRTRTFVTQADAFAMPPSSWTTDPDDTVHALQMRIARALVPALAARDDRLGLVSFTVRTRLRDLSIEKHVDLPAVLAPLGSGQDVLTALADVAPAKEHRRSDLARALTLAAKLLDEATEPRAHRVILVLSLGRPSAPDGIHAASERALDVARKLRRQRIEVWAIPFGAADVGYLRELTGLSGGRVVELGELPEVFGGA